MNHYCLDCGTQMTLKFVEGRQREQCPKCGWIYYCQRKVSAGVTVESNGRLLLVQRGIEPWHGKWCLPAGYLEVDEEPQDAAIREAFEETGLTVRLTGGVQYYTYDDDPRGNGLVLIFDAEIVSGDLKITPETLQAGFFTPQEVRGMQIASTALQKQVNVWLDRKMP